MILTFNWLKKYFNTLVSPEKILEVLDNIGFEVESVRDGSKLYEGFIVAEIKLTKEHENANKLKMCEVDAGTGELLQIVCGAQNARAGIKVVLATVGSIVPSNGMKIKQSKIRSVISNGMLCSESELMLGSDGSGIIELPSDAPVGASFAGYYGLNEVVVDIAITPNRGDATSIYGIARDLEAAGLGKLKNVKLSELELSEGNSKSNIPSKEIFGISDAENVSEFLLVAIEGVNNIGDTGGVSSLIKAIGNSNNGPLVDISNYGMFSLGRPNHMYDADKIDGKINIKLSKGGEEFLALNGETYILPKGLTIIVDEKKVLAIAGVIGGESSKVDEHTKNILLEVGSFSKASVVKAGRALNVNTDSRYRFERMVDTANTVEFARYMLNLIKEYCGGKPKYFQCFKSEAQLELEKNEIKIEYNSKDFEKLVGVSIEQAKIDSCLGSLGFRKTGNSYIVPSYRRYDVEGKADLTEEVLRINGTELINSEKFKFTPNTFSVKREEKLDKLRFFLTSRGYTEQVSWSFYGEKASELLSKQNNDGKESAAIHIANPISQEMSIMRQSVFPNLLEILEKNLNRGYSSVSFFEIGKVFRDGKEINVLAGLRCGEYTNVKLHKRLKNKDDEEARELDYFDIKSDIEACVQILGFDYSKFSIKRETSNFFHPQISSKYCIGKKEVLQMGKAHPQILKEYGVEKQTVYFFELNLNEIPIKLKDKFNRMDISDLQHVNRDLAFVVPQKFDSIDLVNFIKQQDKKNIHTVKVFDNYTDSENIRSLGIRLELAPKDKTFTEQEIENIVENVITKVREKFKFELKST